MKEPLEISNFDCLCGLIVVFFDKTRTKKQWKELRGHIVTLFDYPFCWHKPDEVISCFNARGVSKALFFNSCITNHYHLPSVEIDSVFSCKLSSWWSLIKVLQGLSFVLSDPMTPVPPFVQPFGVKCRRPCHFIVTFQHKSLFFCLSDISLLFRNGVFFHAVQYPLGSNDPG